MEDGSEDGGLNVDSSFRNCIDGTVFFVNTLSHRRWIQSKRVFSTEMADGWWIILHR
jgi:hypothetical protein